MHKKSTRSVHTIDSKQHPSSFSLTLQHKIPSPRVESVREKVIISYLLCLHLTIPGDIAAVYHLGARGQPFCATQPASPPVHMGPQQRSAGGIRDDLCKMHNNMKQAISTPFSSLGLSLKEHPFDHLQPSTIVAAQQQLIQSNCIALNELCARAYCA